MGNPVGRFYGPGLEIANSFLPTPNDSHTGETGACCLPRHTGGKEKCLLNTNQSLPQFGCTHNSENTTFFMGKCSYEKFPEWTGKFPKIPSTLNHSFIYASITNQLPMHSLLYSLHVYWVSYHMCQILRWVMGWQQCMSCVSGPPVAHSSAGKTDM